jgi:hypothetical protein
LRQICITIASQEIQELNKETPIEVLIKSIENIFNSKVIKFMFNKCLKCIYNTIGPNHKDFYKIWRFIISSVRCIDMNCKHPEVLCKRNDK